MLYFPIRYTQAPSTPPDPAPFGLLVSRGRTATASSTGGGNSASQSVDSNYNTIWQAGSLPATLEIDIDGLGLTWTAFAWHTKAEGFVSGAGGQDIGIAPGDYTIEADFGSGFEVLTTVTNNLYGSRVHIVDLTGATDVRISITQDADGGTDASQIQVDLWDVSLAINGAHDQLLCGIYMLGDSITAWGMCLHNSTWLFGQTRDALGDQVYASDTKRTLQLCAGFPGYRAYDIAPIISDLMDTNVCKYVTVNLGTNDALLSVSTATYLSSMTTICEEIVSRGCIPIVPTIPWCDSVDVSPYNAQLSSLFSAVPQCIAGPDLYAYFNANQSEISDIHPTSDGYLAQMDLWVAWCIANEIY